MTGVGVGEAAGTWERRICWKERALYESGNKDAMLARLEQSWR